MEARLIHAAICAATLLSLGAGYRTQNFIVEAPTPHFAQQVALRAENYRRDLAVEWLGRELPPWSQPCPIRVDVGPNKGAGGVTRFAFHHGQPFDWSMSIQGPADRIVDSVLPHEITHTIFATHFGRPLPRWADEGACTTVEHESERQKQHRMLYEFLTTGRGIAFNHMFAITEYPPDVLPLYSQGYSLARYLIAQGGKRKFIEYIGDGMRWNNWTKATQTHYAFHSLSDLQVSWLDWVKRGCPAMAAPSDTLLASGGTNSAPGNTNDGPAGPSVDQQADGTRSVPATLTGQADGLASNAPRAPLAQLAAVSGTKTGGATGPAPPAASVPSVPASAGWYARVRDEAAGRSQGGSQGGSPSTSVSANPLHQAVGEALSRNTSPATPQVVTRPQPFERPKQRVLQW
jgi:hypothetical protein